MNSNPLTPGSASENWLELRLQQAAPAFPYPSTPDIAGNVRRQLERLPARPAHRAALRPAWLLALFLLAAAALFAIPGVRAAVLEFIQVGVVRIFLVEPTPTPTESAPTPQPQPTPISSLLNLAGETTLEEAIAQSTLPVRLPSYPPDLGPPDYVFLQDYGGDLLFLVWTDPEDPGQVLMSLQSFGPDATPVNKWYAQQMGEHPLEMTEVNGSPAVWTTGPYLLELKTGDLEMRRILDGHTLIWSEGEITYRLETHLTLEEALQTAHSLEDAR